MTNENDFLIISIQSNLNRVNKLFHRSTTKRTKPSFCRFGSFMFGCEAGDGSASVRFTSASHHLHRRICDQQDLPQQFLTFEARFFRVGVLTDPLHLLLDQSAVTRVNRVRQPLWCELTRHALFCSGRNFTVNSVTALMASRST